MAAYIWYFTPVTRIGSSNNWNVGASEPKSVWFGSSAPPNPGDYDLIIIDNQSVYGKVGSQELRNALQAAGFGNVPAARLGSVALTNVPGQPEPIHTVGFVNSGSIQNGTTGYAISLIPLTAGPINVSWAPGTGNFIQFFPGSLSDTCFVRGTLIETEHGPKAVEDLNSGDYLVTKDHGLQPIRWIGSSWRSAIALSANPKLVPIAISKDTFGPGKPNQDLEFSPQHRILVHASQAQTLFGSNEVLVAAKHLCHLDGIGPVKAPIGTQYFHLLLPQHEIIYANGLEAESLYSGPEAIKILPPDAITEIESLFPGLIDAGIGIP